MEFFFQSVNAKIDGIFSAEFDKDGEFCALAGVAKRIKLYDFRAVLANPTAYHYPMTQIQCAAKISNVSWNPYCKNMLSNSDYDGTVQIWDVSAQCSIKRYQVNNKLR
ncbi:unnamed protein product [Gongylonema pulchrum]|uniref:WD_REPEATS_REGION domain-containing protein n=1 Tax=Gongylonema pulchrum TaxID=637853 RepID=A0A183EY40_9BILA|nr:unnamed protein product [Gongylonema pulchrum]